MPTGLDHGKAQQRLMRQGVPSAFCSQFCCAYVAQRCLASSCGKHECLWTAQKAFHAVSLLSGKTKVPQEVFTWASQLNNNNLARRRG